MFVLNQSSRKSGNIAKERLQLVLVHDRSTITPSFLDMIKSDIIRVLSNYIEIDGNDIDVQVSRKKTPQGTRSTLTANIPVCQVKNSARKMNE